MKAKGAESKAKAGFSAFFLFFVSSVCVCVCVCVFFFLFFDSQPQLPETPALDTAILEPKKVYKKWDELKDVKLTTPLQKKRNSISS